MWLPQWSSFQTLDQGRQSTDVGSGINQRKLFPTDWENLRVLQLLFTDSEAQSGQPAPEHPGRHESEQDPAQRDLDTSGQLPTIPEGPEEDESSEGLESYLQS